MTTLEKIGEEDMTEERTLPEAGQQYATAHDAHYRTKNLHEAVELYRGIMVAHPGTREAAYSRAQIQNIAHSVVPEQDLLDAQIELTLACLEH